MAALLGSIATASTNVGGTSPYSFPATTVLGDNRITVVVAKTVGGAAPTGVTHNGVAMTPDGNAAQGFNISVWHIDNPAIGTYNVIVTLAAGGALVAIAIPSKGTDLTRVPALGTATTGSSAAASCSSPPGGVNDLQLGFVAVVGAVLTSAGAPQAVVPSISAMPLPWQINAYDFSADYIPPPSAGNFAWTLTSGTWNALGVTIYGPVGSTTEQILIDDPLRVGGSSQLFLGTVLDDTTGDTIHAGGADLKVWAADINTMMGTLFRKSQFLGDANKTLLATDPARFVYQNVTLTANRVITLPNTGLKEGMRWKFVRRAVTPGAFTLSVTDPLSARSVAIAANTNGFIHVRAIGTAEWLCEAQGTIP